MATFTNIYQLQEEIEVFARNQNFLTLAERGVTTVTDTLSSTGEDVFSLTTTTSVFNIRYVTDASTTKSSYTEFTPTYSNKTITMTGVSSGAEVVINYDTGSIDHVYGGLPQTIFNRLTYPRIRAKVVTGTPTPFSLGAGSYITDRFVTFQVWATTQKRCYNVMNQMRQDVMTNAKNFAHFPYIKPINVQFPEIDTEVEQHESIFSAWVDCDAQYDVERV